MVASGTSCRPYKRGGVKTTPPPPPPQRKKLNNEKFRQAKGLPDFFTEPNLVLHVFGEFQQISFTRSRNIASLCHVIDFCKVFWLKSASESFCNKISYCHPYYMKLGQITQFMVRNNLPIHFF